MKNLPLSRDDWQKLHPYGSAHDYRRYVEQHERDNNPVDPSRPDALLNRMGRHTQSWKSRRRDWNDWFARHDTPDQMD